MSLMSPTLAGGFFTIRATDWCRFFLSYVCLFSHQSRLILCNPMDYSPPGSSVHGVSQARIQSGLPFPSPGVLPDPGVRPESPAFPALADGFFTTEPPGKPSFFFWKPSSFYPIIILIIFWFPVPLRDAMCNTCVLCVAVEIR